MTERERRQSGSKDNAEVTEDIAAESQGEEITDRIDDILD